MKGPREYEFACLRVTEKVHRGRGKWAGCWPVARSAPPTEPRSGATSVNAPATTAFAELAVVGCLRRAIEEDVELAKGEVGLDHYEVTKFRGWYHHITLSLLALASLGNDGLIWPHRDARIWPHPPTRLDDVNRVLDGVDQAVAAPPFRARSVARSR